MEKLVYWLLALLPCALSMMIDGKQMTMDAAIIKAGSNGSQMYEIMMDEKTVRVELDILYPMEVYMEMRKEMTMAEKEDEASSARKKRKAVRDQRYRWTNARVPYDISYELTSSDRRIINAAIADYHRYTCVRFAPARSTDRNRVRFQNGAGCSSYVGMIGGQQAISLAPGCRYKGIVIHEMGHAIGFNHEQTRPNRDGYVYIRRENIQQGLEYNFMKYSPSQQNDYDVPYDYSSVMHYSQYAFSRNGQITIQARQAQYQNQMGNRDGFSFNDIKLANLMYGCAERNSCPARSCPRDGFQGQDCKCYCDSGSRSNPLMECGGNAVTTPSPVVVTTGSPLCSDNSRYCPSWARSGYCTGQYQNYMMANCKLSCNYCQTTTTTTTTMPTPPVENCVDENQYCSSWARNGECSRNPSYMLNHCKRSCEVCEGETRSCNDNNELCPQWARYCDAEVYKEYLEMNCRRSCGVCSANDEEATTVTATTLAPNQSCMDKRPTAHCEAQKARGKCAWSPTVGLRCQKTCRKC